MRKTSLRRIDVIARQFHLFTDQIAVAFRICEQFVVGGDVALFGLLRQFRVGADHAHFQSGGAADDVFGFCRIGHAGQLHHDAVCACLLDDGFGRAQFIDAVVQCVDVLFHGIAADLRQQRFGQRDGQLRAFAGQLCAFHHVVQFGQDFLNVGRVLEGDNQAVAAFADGAGADALLAQGAACIAGIAVKRFFQRGLHVHLHGEVYAAAQVQAQEHGTRADFFQPFRAVGDLVLRHDVAFAQCVVDSVAGGNFVGVGHAHFQAAACNKHAVVGNVGFLQRVGNGFFGGLVNVDGLAVGGNLDGGGHAV